MLLLHIKKLNEKEKEETVKVLTEEGEEPGEITMSADTIEALSTIDKETYDEIISLLMEIYFYMNNTSAGEYFRGLSKEDYFHDLFKQ